MTTAVFFDPDLVRRYNVPGPRYTSYPTAALFHTGFDERRYRQAIKGSNSDLIPRPLSLYIHIPFCRHLCFFCACNKVVTRNRETIEGYLRQLVREIELTGSLFDADRNVEQLHFGGGTPTALDPAQMAKLMRTLGREFSLLRSGRREFSIEVDPRTVDDAAIGELAELGFNRISFGLQDFDAAVQKAVNRIQPMEATLEVIRSARRHGFEGISTDLIYGLPLQTPDGFGRTLDHLLEALPDRIALYSYAHLPALFPPQKRIRETDLPSPDAKLAIMEMAIEKLTAAGYVYVGMDHFARPEDDLVLAQKQGGLQRNFQGYSTHRHCDLVGLGLSAISAVGDTYSQNTKDLVDYHAALEQGRLPVQRGIELGNDDRIRRDVIQALMCHSGVEFADIEQRHDIGFHRYFAPELRQLKQLEEDGLIAITGDSLEVLPRGRLLLRAVCAAFDSSLSHVKRAHHHSRMI